MKFEIKTEIRINASAQKIWSILIDFEDYPKWNPLILSVDGTVAEGKQIEVRIKGSTFNPVVTAYEINHRLQWRGKLLFHCLFSGEHRFTLTEHADGYTTFQHNEIFTGILVNLLKKQLIMTKRGFEEMNRKLKEKSEIINK